MKIKKKKRETKIFQDIVTHNMLSFLRDKHTKREQYDYFIFQLY